jgi:two-component system, OmpR family, response regulator
VPETKFEFRGDLASTPLPEVLQTVYHYKVPGVVTAAHEGVEKKIFIWGGDVIFASSGERADSLGDYLLRTGRITQEQMDQSVEQLLLSGGDKRHGTILVEMAVLSPQELFEIVTDQVKSIIFSMFAWEEGEFSFDVGQFKTDETIQLAIPARQVILDGVKTLKDARRLVSFLGPSWTVFDPAYAPPELGDLVLDVGEIRLLQHVDGTKTLRELVTLGPGDAAHNAKLIYAFYALKLITRRETAARAVKKIQWKTAGGEFSPGGQ